MLDDELPLLSYFSRWAVRAHEPALHGGNKTDANVLRPCCCNQRHLCLLMRPWVTLTAQRHKVAVSHIPRNGQRKAKW